MANEFKDLLIGMMAMQGNLSDPEIPDLPTVKKGKRKSILPTPETPVPAPAQAQAAALRTPAASLPEGPMATPVNIGPGQVQNVASALDLVPKADLSGLQLTEAKEDLKDAKDSGIPDPIGIPETDEDTAALLLSRLQKSPEQLAAMEKAYEDIISPQQEGISQTERLMEALQGVKPQMDLSPLYALSDAFYGTNFSKTLPKGESAEQLLYKKGQLQDLLQKRRGEVAKSKLELLKQATGGSGTDRLLNALGRTQRHSQEFKLKVEQKLIDNAQKQYLPDFQTVNQMFSKLEGNLARNDLIGLTNTLATFAKTIGDETGRLTEEDIGRTVPRNWKTDLNKLEAYFSNNPTAQFDPQWMETIRGVANVAKKAIIKSWRKRAESDKRIYKASSAYRPYMEPGETGDVIFQEIDSMWAGLLKEGDTNFVTPEEALRKIQGGAKGGKASPPPQSPVPKVGDVKKGYRYKGGPPNKPESWEKVQ